MIREAIVEENAYKDFSFHFVKRNGSEYMMLHKHYHVEHEIYYLTKGERYYFIKDKTYLVKEGDLVFIPSNEIHKTSDASKPSHSRAAVFFTHSFIKDMFTAIPENFNEMLSDGLSYFAFGFKSFNDNYRYF